MVSGEKTFGILCKCGHYRNEHLYNRVISKPPSKWKEILRDPDEPYQKVTVSWSKCNKCVCKQYQARKSSWAFWKK